MKNKLQELIAQAETVFWREFMHLMVSDEARSIFDEMRTIYARSTDIADAKARLETLAKAVE